MINLKINSYRLLRVSLIVGALVIFGCESRQDVQPDSLQSAVKQELKKTKTVISYGPTTPLLGGTARTWVEMVKGKPVQIGVELSEEVLQNMPHKMGEYTIPLPGQAHATGIKTVMVGWNPMGHFPEGIYSVPHFDFHFYMIPERQIMKIKGGIDEGAYKLLEKGVFPSVYTFGPEPVSVPHMGVHWMDVTSPEFSPAGSFSKTFIYGSNNDRVTFLEPMITRDYLLSLKPNESVETPVPSLLKHEDPGYYPESYTIKYDAVRGTYSIALTELEWHNRNK